MKMLNFIFFIIGSNFDFDPNKIFILLYKYSCFHRRIFYTEIFEIYDIIAPICVTILNPAQRISWITYRNQFDSNLKY